MGKYGPSDLHDKFSDWHWKKCARDAYLTDIDRIWVEVREDKLAAVYDLKKETKDKSDPPTWAEIIAANWFEEKGVPYYLVYIREDFTRFILYRHRTRKRKIFIENEMINWINLGCPPWGVS